MRDFTVDCIRPSTYTTELLGSPGGPRASSRSDSFALLETDSNWWNTATRVSRANEEVNVVRAGAPREQGYKGEAW